MTTTTLQLPASIKQATKDHLDAGHRLIVNRQSARWQHPARSALYEPIDRALAILVLTTFENEYQVIEESGPQGQRSILTPMRCPPKDGYIHYDYLSIGEISKIINRSRNAAGKFVSRHGLKRRRWKLKRGVAVKVNECLTDAIEADYGLEVGIDIRYERMVRPGILTLDRDWYSFKDMANLVGITPASVSMAISSNDLPCEKRYMMDSGYPLKAVRKETFAFLLLNVWDVSVIME